LSVVREFRLKEGVSIKKAAGGLNPLRGPEAA